MLHYIGCRLSTSRLRIGFASTPSPFRLTHQSTHTRLYFLLFALASRHYMEADLLFSGVQYSTYLHTHLDITSHLRMHPSSISSNLPFFFLSSWYGMGWFGVFGLGKVKGKHTGVERAAFSECSITSHHTLFPSPTFSRTFRATCSRIIYCIMLVLSLG